MNKIYNKAIRDRIPEIIEREGHQCEFKVLTNGEFLVQLEEKLEEELEEYKQSKSIGELIDLIEIIHRIVEIRGVSVKDIESLRREKNNERGAFSKNIFLIKTTE